MSKGHRLIPIILICSLAPCLVFAGGPPELAVLDLDHDGRISGEEIHFMDTKGHASWIEGLDSNMDGTLEMDEWTAAGSNLISLESIEAVWTSASTDGWKR